MNRTTREDTMNLSLPAFFQARRRGRPRKAANRRDAHGRSRGETAAEITAVVRAQRVKAGAPPADALNALWGSAIGTLHRRWQLDERDPHGISAEQYRAAQAYIATTIRYCELMGIPLPRPAGAEEGATRPDPDDDTVLRVRRRFADFRRALLDAGAALGLGSRVNAAVYRVCIEDPPIAEVGATEVERLRYGLNAIARVAR
jgi:hypothetical protein